MLYPEYEEEYESLFRSADPTGEKRRKVLDHEFLHRLQRKHFLLFDILPFLGAVAAVALLWFQPIGPIEIAVAVAMWVVTGFGISVGYHRLLAHGTFNTTPKIRAALAVFGAMAGQGAPISWVAIHRRHHEFGDREGDMHSPNLSGNDFKGKLRGLLHAHLTWMIAHPYPNVAHYARDLLRDQTMVRIGRHYYAWIALGFVAPAALCGILTASWWGALNGLLWGGFVRMFVLEHGIWSLNSICHFIGTRRFRTKDESRNNAWLAPFTFGEAWHHNHHAFPYSASFGLSWYRLDPGYWLIRVLGLLGLASTIRVPNERQMKERITPRSAIESGS